MKPGRGIDHLVLCVRDLEAARAAYARIGFTLTPPALHPWGTANRLVQLQGNFIELLTVADPAKMAPPKQGEFAFGPFNKAFLGEARGLLDAGFRQRRCPARPGRVREVGPATTYAPFDFSRKAKLPGGEEVTVGFTLSFLTDNRMPEAGFFACQQHAPQHFWKPEYQSHVNGAVAVAEAIMVADEPDSLADLFARFAGQGRGSRTDGGLSVEYGARPGRGPRPPARNERFGDALPRGPATPHFVAYRVAVTDAVGGACPARCGRRAVPRDPGHAPDRRVRRLRHRDRIRAGVTSADVLLEEGERAVARELCAVAVEAAALVAVEAVAGAVDVDLAPRLLRRRGPCRRSVSGMAWSLLAEMHDDRAARLLPSATGRCRRRNRTTSAAKPSSRDAASQARKPPQQ